MCSKRARLFVVLIGFWIISTALVHLLDLGLHLLRLVLVLHAERLILDLLRMRTGSLLRLGRHVWPPEPESDHVSEAKPPLYRPQQQRLPLLSAARRASARGSRRGRAVADAMREAEELGNQFRHSPQWAQDLTRDQVNTAMP